MPTEEAFLRAICADPDDDAPRLIYADWLDERGRPGDTERAEFIRVQVEKERLLLGSPARERLELRASELLLRHKKGWIIQDLKMGGERINSEAARYERGFLVGLLTNFQQLTDNGKTWFKTAPIRKLSVIGSMDRKLLTRMPDFSKLVELEWGWSHLGEQELKALLGTANLRSLERLSLQGNELGTGATEMLAISGDLPRLTHLDLRDNPIGSRGTHSLASSPFYLRLEEVKFDRDFSEATNTDSPSWRSQTQVRRASDEGGASGSGTNSPGQRGRK
jgi:uncharacterized protein (TIGR02996 family)